MAESHSIISFRDSPDVSVYLPNPRKEADENNLFVENKCFLDLALKPTTLEKGLFLEVSEIAKKYADRCERSKIVWKS
jgi:UDP-sulfoquinovose synthase